MTTLQLNAELYREMAKIADDETLMEKVLRYVKKIAAKKEDETLMSQEEFFANVREALIQVNNGNVTRQLPGESVTDMLRRTGYVL